MNLTLQQTDRFEDRHNGLFDADFDQMLKAVLSEMPRPAG